jgi:hypothetical protein
VYLQEIFIYLIDLSCIQLEHLFYNKCIGGNCMRGILLRSIESKTLIEIIYLTKDGSISQRIIRVKEINQNNIYAYCYLRKSYRNFTTSNILSLSPVKKRIKSA